MQTLRLAYNSGHIRGRDHGICINISVGAVFSYISLTKMVYGSREIYHLEI